MPQCLGAQPPFHGAVVGTFLGLSLSRGAQPVGMGGKHSAGLDPLSRAGSLWELLSPFPGGQKTQGASSPSRSQRPEEGISSDCSLLHPKKHSLTCMLSLGLSPRAAPRGSLVLQQENADFCRDLSFLAQLQVSASPVTGELHCAVLQTAQAILPLLLWVT